MNNTAFIVAERGEEREEEYDEAASYPGCAPLFFWEVALVLK